VETGIHFDVDYFPHPTFPQVGEGDTRLRANDDIPLAQGFPGYCDNV